LKWHIAKQLLIHLKLLTQTFLETKDKSAQDCREIKNRKRGEGGLFLP
jgi:hypothetical protein